MENKNGQGIFYGVIGVATLIVAIIGATFAYFSATASNTGGIAGNTAEGSALALTVEKVAPTGTYAGGKLVPLDVTAASGDGQLANALSRSCIDSNNNVVCHIYHITIENASTAALTVSGRVTVTTGAANLSWKLLTNATTNNTGSTPATITSGTPFYVAGSSSAGVTLDGNNGTTNGSLDYYLMIWLEETGSPQDDEDGNKPFSGTVNFDAVDGSGNTQGLTATFTA